MNRRFKCNCTGNIFEAEGRKVEWTDPVYGASFKYVAPCPSCGKDLNEYRAPKGKEKQQSFSAPACGAGCGCSMN